MTTLLLPTLLWVAGFAFWITDRKWPWDDSPAVLAAVVIWGLTTGLFVSAWMP